MADLKNCPFCGAIPKCGVEFYSSSGAEVELSAVVECTECGVRKEYTFKATDNITLVPFYDYDNAFERVINAWNRRVKKFQPDEILRRIQEDRLDDIFNLDETDDTDVKIELGDELEYGKDV